MSGIRTKVRLNIVAIRVSRIKGTGRSNHSIAFFKTISEVVPVKIMQTKIIKIIRQPKKTPERNPSRVMPDIGMFDSGVPGMLRECTIMIIPIKIRKYLISESNFLIGKLDPKNVISKTQVRTVSSRNLTAMVTAMLKHITDINLILPSNVCKIDF